MGIFFPTEYFYWLFVIWEFHIMTLIMHTSQSSQVQSPTFVNGSPSKERKKPAQFVLSICSLGIL